MLQQPYSSEFDITHEVILPSRGGSIWNIPIMTLCYNLVAQKIFKSYIICTEHYMRSRGNEGFSLEDFFAEVTIANINISMCMNMGGGMPCCGFFEMYQDPADAVRFKQIKIIDFERDGSMAAKAQEIALLSNGW